MTLETLRSFLLWCTVINYGMLLVWFLLFMTARNFMRRVHGRWFPLTEREFYLVHYAGMGLYKLGIILFNLVPLIALYVLS